MLKRFGSLYENLIFEENRHVRLLVLFMICFKGMSAIAQPSKDTSFLRISKMKDDTNKVNALFNKAIHLIVSNNEIAGEMARTAYDLSKKLKFAGGEVKCCDLLSEYYKQKGDLTKAYEWLKKTIPSREKKGDNFDLAVTYFQLTNIFRELENYKMALDFSRRSLHYSAKMGKDRFIALSSSSVASVFDAMKELDSALYYYSWSADLQLKIQDSSAAMSSMSNMGSIYCDRGEFKTAIEILQKALLCGKTKGNPSYFLTCYENLSVAYLKSGDMNKAGKTFDECFKIMQQFADVTQRLNIYNNYATYLAKKGDFTKAYAFGIKYRELKDSVDKVEVKKSLNDLETKYQTEKKEQENKLLRQKRKIDELTINTANQKSFVLTLVLVSSIIVLVIVALFFMNRVKTARQLKMQNEQINKQNTTLKTLNSQLIKSEEELQAANEAKGQLLSIISHDISSPIRAQHNYEAGILTKIDGMSESELKIAIANIHKNTSLVFGLSNNLLDYAQTQQDGFVPKKAKIELLKLVNEVKGILETAIGEKKINLQIGVKADLILVCDEDLLRIVLRNLLSNAIKFSPHGGKVSVEWNETLATLKIVDEGGGMSAEKIRNILDGKNYHSQPGTLGEKGTGLGMKLVSNCIDLMNATWDIQNSGKGTLISIKLPV